MQKSNAAFSESRLLLLLFFGEDRGAALMIFSGSHAIGLVEFGDGAEAFLFALELRLTTLPRFHLHECFVGAGMDVLQLGVSAHWSSGDFACGGGSGLRSLFLSGRLRLRLRTLQQHLARAILEIL